MNDNFLNGKNFSNMVRLPGSERTMVPGSQKVGPANPDEHFSVTVIVRRPETAPTLTSMIEEISARPFSERRHLSHEEFAATHGVNPNDVKKLEEFAQEYGLEVKEVNIAAGIVVLSGTVASFSKAFEVDLDTYEHPKFTYRGRTGHVHIPENLTGIVEAVLGLDNRRQASPHFRFLNEEEFAKSHAGRNSFTPPELAQLYNFPSINCKDQCIGLIELCGAQNRPNELGGYRSNDLEAYFNRLGVRHPEIVDVSIDGATNQPSGDPNSADGEVVLDIEVAAAVAPGARIAVYFAPNTDVGFLKAITTAIHDTRNKPSVVSISWGNPEREWAPQAIKAMDRAFQDAAALGVTICCASGDNGSSDYRAFSPHRDNLVHADFPASSPYVLACGGTRLEGSGRTITKEVVWNEGKNSATGGGVSDVFDLPNWQVNANVPPSVNPGGKIGRGVPDVAGNADPATGYQILVDGQQLVSGGTSAVAPLWAGLLANINQKLGHSVGFINPKLYTLSAQDNIFHDITTGNNDTIGENGPYKAQPGWDACTGLGSPDGTELMNKLSE
ncbi:protease pro-enzyme activation domain-containing protein [Paenibacillus farraposensis]|uniref:Protease pro-enzyme activation domain-containing protein n=1 Tax=Paenibacillus farraposensis TaxID=2807095 RepID=A0ABW4DL81_9BACL|nr:S53 family peptidase [Paenibacillus farraposensis]MCC3380594.1 S8/S53 family peptidase [Paenibacillus farraposensis]